MAVPLTGRVIARTAVCVLALVAAPAATAARPLSKDTSRPDVASTHGSGIFGSWTVDGWGLPAYRYELDPDTDPRAAQVELAGKTDAWHQLGNDHAIATAHNRGHVMLWSQDRTFQFTNFAEPSLNHHAGGYGYLRTGDRTISTLYADRPAGADTERLFGAGYFGRRTRTGGVDVREQVYAPWGDDPVLLHDVAIANTGKEPLDATWFEYWDVNPYRPVTKSHRGLTVPTYDAATRTLRVGQLPEGRDTDPLSIFAASLNAPVEGWTTNALTFFGQGGRANPDEVAAGRLSGTPAPPVPTGASGQTLFAFQTPVKLAPGETITLRYAYGYGHDEQIDPLVAKWRAAPEPLERSQRAWAKWLPRADLGPGRTWLNRELQWDLYMLRSGVSYEEACGHHILSQGGYYQYAMGHQIAFRDPLQHILPLIYAEPEIARETIRYSAKEQPLSIGQIPYGMTDMCTRLDFGSSNDLDLWLILAAAEYGLATRDLAFFDEKIAWADAGEATLWEHLVKAHAHQESQRGPHGGYVIGATGDWSDFSTQFLEMTESILVSAQAAFIYPRLAELADLRGDRAFAAELRADAAEQQEVLDREWTGKGWYSRGYSGTTQLGKGVIYGEPQPWAILAGAPSREQSKTLVGHVRRFLTGIGAPEITKGPAKIGSSQSPARNDPDVTEKTKNGRGVGSNNAVYVGGAWYAINGPLTWALGALDGIVPNAREYALDELERNTLARHATVYPEHWNGVISVDDACFAHYEADPSRCGVGLNSDWNTQLMHQPAWSAFALLKLAGIEPTAAGYRIDPHLPLPGYSLRLPRVGVAAERGGLRGYVTPEADGPLTFEVRGTGVASVNGRRVRSTSSGGFVRFTAPGRAGRPLDWAVTSTRRAGPRTPRKPARRSGRRPRAAAG